MNIAIAVLLLWLASIVLLTWTLARAGARSRQADEAADAEYQRQAEARVAGLATEDEAFRDLAAAAVKEAEAIVEAAWG